MLILSSVMKPAGTALLYGKLPKLVARLSLEFVLRKVFVKSMNPIGTIVASPILSCNGAEGSAACGAGAGAGFTAGAASGAVFGLGPSSSLLACCVCPN